MISQKAIFLCLAAGALPLVGCGGDDPAAPDPVVAGLDQLPADTGGSHLALPRNPDDPAAAPQGCYLYLPAGWEDSPAPYPLLVFLHGAGERGDSADDPDVLAVLLRNGPPRLIDRQAWAPPYPMIVVSPQCHSGWWNPDDVRALLEWVDLHYPIDRTRIFLTGLSMGGYGTWSYLGRFGGEAEDPLPIAAAAPICGGGGVNQAAAMAGTPIWAFHGTSDGTVPPTGSVNLIKAIGAEGHADAPRLTLYDGVGHNSWSRTYDGSGLGEGLTTYAADSDVNPWLVPYDVDLYEWFFSHRR